MERIYSLDLLKFIAITLVVFYHSFYGENITYTNLLFPVYSIGVPIFFMINGALLFNKDLDIKKHYRKIANIISLTLIWTVLIILIIRLFTDEISTFKDMVKIAWFGDSRYVVNQYWFLKALVILYLCFPILKQAFNTNKLCIVIFFITITVLVIGYNFMYLSHQMFNIFFNKSIVVEGKEYIPWYNFCKDFQYSFSFVYFILGGIIFFFHKNIKILNALLLFFISFGTAIYIAFIFNKNMIHWDPCFNGYPSLMTFVMSTTTFLFLYNQKIRNLPSVIEKIGKDTLGIYLVHGIIIYFTKPIISPYGINYYPLYAITILFTSWVIVRICKHIPFISKLFSI